MKQEPLLSAFTRLRDNLLSMSRRILQDEDDASDAIQDAFCRLWPLRDKIRDEQEASALTVTTTRNLCIDRIRSRPPTSPLKGMEADVADTDERHPERIERMMDIVRTLPDMQQIILRLRHIEGMEMKEIARLTGSTEVAVRKALSRARMAVKKQYMRRKEE